MKAQEIQTGHVYEGKDGKLRQVIGVAGVDMNRSIWYAHPSNLNKNRRWCADRTFARWAAHTVSYVQGV